MKLVYYDEFFHFLGQVDEQWHLSRIYKNNLLQRSQFFNLKQFISNELDGQLKEFSIIVFIQMFLPKIT